MKMRDETNHKNRNEVYFEVRAVVLYSPDEKTLRPHRK